MPRNVIFLASLLCACNAPVADEIARSAARRAVEPVLAARFPGVPLMPATNCIIDNATAPEIITLATSARSAPESATRIVLDVAQRPATIQCLATDGLPVLLNTL